MPATDFGLMLSEKPPIFQVYGTKRKCSSVPADLAELDEKSPKRRCLNSDCMDTDSVTMETQSFTVPDHCLTRCSPQQLPIVQNQHLTHSQPLCSSQPTHDITHTAHSVELENNNHLPSIQPPVFHQQSDHIVPHKTSQSDMIMDLHDEVYTATLQDDCIEAASNMEAEGAPDSQQYGLAFCDKFCVGGDVSPTSRRVRCFCKPSWEDGLMNTRPYISDYY